MTAHIKKTPMFLGQDTTECIRDVVRVAKMEAVAFNATSPVTVIRVPAHTLILGTLVQVVTAFDGTAPVLTIGDSDAAASLLSIVSSDLAGLGWVAGMAGKEYTADQDILVTLTPSTDTTAGSINIWFQYKTDSNRQYA